MAFEGTVSAARAAALRRGLGAAAALGVLAVGAAGADWLVTPDGARIETRGPWEVRGGSVLFHLPTGTLSSLRLADVDLDASRAATAAAGEAATKPAPTPPPRPVRLVLTDADVGHVEAALPAPAANEGERTAGVEPAAAAARLAVASWEEVEDPGSDGLTFTGRVTNRSSETLIDAGVVAHLFDLEGTELATSDARLSATNLPPGASATFRADFPSIYDYGRVVFEPRGFALLNRAPEEALPAGEEGEPQ